MAEKVLLRDHIQRKSKAEHSTWWVEQLPLPTYWTLTLFFLPLSANLRSIYCKNNQLMFLAVCWSHCALEIFWAIFLFC